jgi:hypothetical protein
VDINHPATFISTMTWSDLEIRKLINSEKKETN